MKYTAEEVRARFEAWAEENGYDVLRNDGFTAAAWHGYQTAYAERIEADEGACEKAAVIWQYRRTSDAQWLDCDELDADAWKQTGLHEVRKLFTHPPAQAARVDQVGELLAIIHGDGGHYQAEHGLQKAAKDAQEKVIQMMTRIATAEPVAQPAESGRVPDGWVLVPREPTKAMLDAAMAREDDEPLTDWGKIIPAPHAEIYKAMLAAAPQPGESA